VDQDEEETENESQKAALGLLGPRVYSLVDRIDERVLVLLGFDVSSELGSRLRDRRPLDVQLVAKALDVALQIGLVHFCAGDARVISEGFGLDESGERVCELPGVSRLDWLLSLFWFRVVF